jgi:Peptidase A4 family
MLDKLAASAAAALALTGMSGSGAMAGAGGQDGARPARAVLVRSVTSYGSTATVRLRGGWRLARVTFPETALAHPHVTGASSTSGDWSGYADTGHNVAFRFVAANFTAPNADCAASTLGKSGEALAYTWAGLDGFTSDTVEQDGFAEECTSSTSHSYYAWYEMYPSSPVMVSGPKPGDALVASVYFNSSTSKYTLEVNDLTQHGAGFTVTESCPSGHTCDNNSAEVITEAPGGGVAGGYDLADFGAVGYTNAAVTSRAGVRGGLATTSLWSPTSITMTDPSSDTMATAGPLQGSTAFLESFVKSN